MVLGMLFSCGTGALFLVLFVDVRIGNALREGSLRSEIAVETLIDLVRDHLGDRVSMAIISVCAICFTSFTITVV